MLTWSITSRASASSMRPVATGSRPDRPVEEAGKATSIDQRSPQGQDRLARIAPADPRRRPDDGRAESRLHEVAGRSPEGVLPGRFVAPADGLDQEDGLG